MGRAAAGAGSAGVCAAISVAAGPAGQERPLIAGCSRSREERASRASARMIVDSTTTSFGPPIMIRCSTSSPAHDHQLALAVDLEGVDEPKPLLTAAPPGQFDAAAEDDPEEDEEKRHANEQANGRQNEGERAILSEETRELHVLRSLGSAGKRTNYHEGQGAGPKG